MSGSIQIKSAQSGMDITFCKGIMFFLPVLCSFDKHALITLFDSFHLCTFHYDGESHCGGNAGLPLVILDDDDQNYGRYTYHWQWAFSTINILQGTLRLPWQVLVPADRKNVARSRGASPGWPLRCWTGWRLWQGWSIKQVSRIQVRCYLIVQHHSLYLPHYSSRAHHWRWWWLGL